MKIIVNLWQVGGPELTASGDAAVYLVRFGESAALVDAGCGFAHERLVENIGRCIPPAVSIQDLFLTHCHFDHTGGAAALRDHFGCRIVAHEKEAGFLEAGDSEVTAASWYGSKMNPLSVDYRVTGSGESFSVGDGSIRAIWCPGHSPGSMVYLAEIGGKRVLFGQDVHGPLHPDLLSDRQDYLQSLKMLLALEADILCEGHFGVMQGQERVRRFISSYLTS